MSIFNPLFEQFNAINQKGLCIWTPWTQLLPPGFKAAQADQMPIFSFVEEHPVSSKAAASTPTPPRSSASRPPPPRSSAPTRPDCRGCAKW
eukprot:6202932-Pleurochrysis_carterae.AAC.1